MQEINLLQNKLKDRSDTWDRRNMLISGVMAVISVAVLAAGGFLYFLNGQVKADTDEKKTENAAIQAKLDSGQGDLADAKAFQAQLRNINTLLSGHVYWSEVFDEVQAATLKQSQYLLMQSKTDGKAHVEGLTSSYSDLGKLLLSLSTNEKLTDVRLLSVQRSSGARTGFNFSIDFKIKPELFSKQ